MSPTAVLITFAVIFLAELPDKTMVASLVLGSRFRPLYVWVGVAAAFAVQVTLAVAAGSALSLLPSRAVDAVAALLFALGAVLVLREGADDEAHGEDEAYGEKDEAGAGTRVEAGVSAAAEGTRESNAARPASRAAGSAGEGLAAGASVAGASGGRTSGGRASGGKSSVSGGSAGGRSRSGFLRVAATSFTVVFIAELGDLTQFSTANLAARYSAPVAVWLGAVLALWTVAAMAIAGGRGLLRVLSVRLITRIAAVAFTVLALISLVDAIRG